MSKPGPAHQPGLLQSSSYEWVSASGVARVSKDRAKIRELYDPTGRRGSGRRAIPVTVRPMIPASCSSRIDVHAAVFLEVDKPKPVVLFELAKGWLTASARRTRRNPSVWIEPHR